MFPERVKLEELVDFSGYFDNHISLIEKLCECLDSQILLWEKFGAESDLSDCRNYINNVQMVIDSWNKTGKEFVSEYYKKIKEQESLENNTEGE